MILEPIRDEGHFWKVLNVVVPSQHSLVTLEQTYGSLVSCHILGCEVD